MQSTHLSFNICYYDDIHIFEVNEMIKHILILSSLILITGCASADESLPEENNQVSEVKDEAVINSQSVSLSEESDFEAEDDQDVEEDNEFNEVDEVEIEPKRPWEEFEDINEFMNIYYEEDRYTVADAAELEDQIEIAFQDELPDQSYMISGRWSGFLFTFADQMSNYYSDEYIDKLLELNDAITKVQYEGSIEEIQQLVQEAREIRESE